MKACAGFAAIWLALSLVFTIERLGFLKPDVTLIVRQYWIVLGAVLCFVFLSLWSIIYLICGDINVMSQGRALADANRDFRDGKLAIRRDA